jgi:hypothetical protein
MTTTVPAYTLTSSPTDDTEALRLAEMTCRRPTGRFSVVTKAKAESARATRAATAATGTAGTGAVPHGSPGAG